MKTQDGENRVLSQMHQSRRSKHAILASVGTDGDVHPFLGPGMALRARGYQVTLATHEHFARLASESDLEFRPLVSNAETEKLLGTRDFWHPLKGPLVIARWGAQFIRRQYNVLKELASGDNAVLIASPGIVAARVVQEELGVPLASIVLQPWMIPSMHAPPAMMGGLTLPRWAPRFAGRAYYRLFDGVGALLIGKELKHLRSSLGLKPIQRMFQWWFSPTLVLGMFPEWFGEPQLDWPPQMKLTGFPVSDGRPRVDVPLDIRTFCASGKPPVVFTFGTGMMHAAELFRDSVEACRMLGVRGVFLTKFRSQVPAELPQSVLHCEFAPFQKLFPLCAAVVHHGGIGTAAKALAAGVPQLILPFAFDQMDNAQRIKQLGAGNWLKPKQRGAVPLAKALAILMTPEAAQRSRSLATRFRGSDGLEMAADALEQLLE